MKHVAPPGSPEATQHRHDRVPEQTVNIYMRPPLLTQNKKTGIVLSKL